MVGADQRVPTPQRRVGRGIARLAAVALLVLTSVPGAHVGAEAAAPASAPEQVPASVRHSFKTVLYDGFSGKKLDVKQWRNRRTGAIVSNRYCEVPAKNNNVVAGGKLRLTVRPATAVESVTISTQATAAQVKDGLAASGCPAGAYTYAMIGGDKKKSARVYYGRLTARVLNPAGQGPYGSVWMRALGDSTKSLTSEIDMFESWGYGRGITNYVHYRDAAGVLNHYPVTPNQYIATGRTDQPGFWTSYHTYGVEWVPTTDGLTSFTFTLDGAVTARYVLLTPKTLHYVVISNILAEFSIPWLSNPAHMLAGVAPARLPQTMVVDWVRLERLVL